MSIGPDPLLGGAACPEDLGWVAVDDWCPDPVDAVYDVEADVRGWESAMLSDAEVLAGRGAVSEWDLAMLASIDPRGLDRAAQLEFLRCDRDLEGMRVAQRMRLLVAMVGERSSGDSLQERQYAVEVAQVLRVGEGAAETQIALARTLSGEFTEFLDALGRGEVSEWHCRELMKGTHHVTDPDVIAALQRRLLPKAKRMTPAKFRREVQKAVADLDAEKAAERLERARADRHVFYRAMGDGLGVVGLVTDDPTARRIYETACADGRALRLERGGAAAARAGDDDALADACRADALSARVLGTVDDDGSISWSRSDQHVSLTVVMDLDTLRGEAERHGLLDGEPVPAAIARDYAGIATTWRRALAAPVTGHLLDYGREQYLPSALRDHVLMRDQCRAPGCTVRALSRLEMDHAVPFPEGETSASNCGGLCRRHHQLKTAGRDDIEDAAADGSATWVTEWGQRIRIPPRPFLHDPVDHQPDPPPSD